MTAGSTTTHTLSVLVEDKPGVLARVAALFSRRGFNIESLAVGATEQKDMSRMTIVVSADAMVWPMVPQGVSNSYVQYARDHAPSWEGDETPDGKDADLAIPPLPDAGAPR